MGVVPTFVVIPTRDRFDLLVPLVTDLLLQDEYELLLIMDNSDEQNVKDYLVLDKKLLVIPCPGMSIYEMWNQGWQLALVTALEGPCNVAFLNDDITIPSRFLSRMSAALRSEDRWFAVYPDYNATHDDEVVRPLRPTQGTYKDGGMCGFAFMVRGEHTYLMFDEDFEIWYGDDNFTREVERCGGEIGRVVGVPCGHVESATVNLHPELQAAMGRDGQRWQERVGGR